MKKKLRKKERRPNFTFGLAAFLILFSVINCFCEEPIINYPRSNMADKEKLAAIYSTLEQMRLEHNRVGEMAKLNWPEHQGQWAAYTKIFRAKQSVLLREKNRLEENIRKAHYTEKQWKELTRDERASAELIMYGDKQKLKDQKTTASSVLLDQLKAVDFFGLEGQFVDPIEDFTTFTEVDPQNHLTRTSSKVEAIYGGTRGTYYTYKSYGSGHFGDFEHLMTISYNTDSNYQFGGFWYVGNDYGPEADFSSGIGVHTYHYRLYLTEYLSDDFDGWGDDTGEDGPAENTPYYLTVKRDGSDVDCYIYSDSARTTLEFTLSLSDVETTAFEYVGAGYSIDNDSNSSASMIDFYIENLDLQEEASIEYVNGAQAYANGSATSIAAAAASHTAGNLLVVFAKSDYASSRVVSGITDTAGNTYTYINRVASTNGDLEVWYAKNIIGNANNVVTATFTGAVSWREIQVLQYSGCDKDDPYDVSGTGYNTSAVTSQSTAAATTNQADEVIVAAYSEVVSTGQSFTAGANFTKRLTVAQNDFQSEDRIVSSTGSYGSSLTVGVQSAYLAIHATFKMENESDITTGLIGYWKLDESPAIHGTTVVDDSGQGHNGTLSTNNGSTNKSVTGQIGQAISFDGTDDYAYAPDVADGTGYDFSTGASFTISAWIKPTTNGSGQGIVIKEGDAAPNWAFEIALWGSDGQLGLNKNDGGASDDLISTTGVTAGVWSHVAAVKSGTTVTFYINGDSAGGGTWDNGGPGWDTLNIGAGGSYLYSSYFSGPIDDVRIYNRALTQDDMTELYSYTVPPDITSGLVGYWPLDENPAIQNTTVIDYSGAGNNGTLTTNDGSANKSVTGQIGQALVFDGSDDNVQLPDSADLMPLTYTISAWFRGDDVSPDTAQHVVALHYNDVTIQVRNSLLRGWGFDSTGVLVQGVTTLNDDTWYHVTFSYDGTTYRLYLNGLLENYTEAGISWEGETHYPRIGISSNGSLPFDGIIDDVRIYNRALTQADITELYNYTALTEITIVQTTKVEPGSTGTTIPLVLDSQPSVDNLLVAFCGNSDYNEDRTVSPPDGTWTKIEDATYTNAQLTVWWKVVQSGDGTGYTFTVSGSDEHHSGVLYEIQGADTTTPINQSDISTNTQTSPTVTPTVIGTLALAALATNDALDLTGVSSGWSIDEEAKPAYHGTYGASRDALTTDTTTGIFNVFTISSPDSPISATVLITPAAAAGTTTIGDGSSPANKDAEQSSTNNAVNAFTLVTDTGTDTVTALTVTFSGTDVNDVASGGVKIWDDSTGGTPNEWDAGDTEEGSASFSDTTADVTVSISVNTSATQYLVTYDIASGATDDNTLQGAITAATATNTIENNDNTDATLTVSSSDCSYSYRKKLTIQASEVVGSSDHTDFPMVVRLSGDWLKTTTEDPANGHIEDSNGYDIIFKDTAGTQLDHEIEEYDGSASGGTLVAWVRIPVLDYDDDTVIYMFYGNPCISTSQENVTGVWDDNYLAVWHLKETPTVDSYAYDSAETNNGTFQGGMTSGAQDTGRIDGSLEFDGNNDYISIPDNTDWTLSTGLERTFEGWFNFTTLPSSSSDWDSIVNATNNLYTAQFGYSSGVRLNWWDNSNDYMSSAISIQTGEWYHCVITIKLGVTNGSHWYFNGQDLGSFTAPNVSRNPTGLGVSGQGSETSFTGKLDEVRISDIARSIEWIQTQHNNQKENSTFIEEGDEDLCTFSYQRAITIQASQVSGTTDLTDFPVVISLSGTWLRTSTADPTSGHVENSNGYDIIFKDSTGTTQLDHEIEEYDGSASGGTLVAWVRIPTLDHDDNTIIYMHYGNSCISSSQENVSGVWNTNYKGVWHLGEKYALAFDGSADYVDCGEGDNITENKGALTVSGWVYKNTGDGTRTAIGSQEGVFEMGTTPSLEWNFRVTNGSASSDEAHTGVLTYDTWVHLVGVYDGTNILIYENGVQSTAQVGSLTGNTATTTNNILLAQEPAYTDKLDGMLNEVRIWTRALSPTEISDLYQGNPVSRTGLVGEWLMNEGTGNTVSDSSGEGNDGDMTGHAATWIPIAKDSTLNANHGTSGGSMTSADQVTGRVNGSLDFDGSDDNVKIAHHASIDFADESFSYSMWIKGDIADNTTQYGNRILSKGTSSGGCGNGKRYELYVDCYSGGDDIEFTIDDAIVDTKTGRVASDYLDTTWHYITYTRNVATNEIKVYLDGNPDGVTDTDGSGDISNGCPLFLAAENEGDGDIKSGRCFNGTLDEVRISDIVRPIEWIETEYNNQKPNSTFFDIEDEDGDSCTFSYRKPITIQASQVSGSSDLTNFPALISLSGDWLKTTTADPTNGRIENSNGHDIIFRDSSGTTQLDHEIEEYDGSASGGTLVAWVRIPTLDHDEDTAIYMYYGNPCIDSSTENVAGVWDDDYVGVWHLAAASTTGYELDSTSNDNHGLNAWNAEAEDFDDITDWLDDSQGTYTVEESPEGQLHVLAGAGDSEAERLKTNMAYEGDSTYTVEVRVKFDALANFTEKDDGVNVVAGNYKSLNDNVWGISFFADGIHDFDDGALIVSRTINTGQWYVYRFVVTDDDDVAIYEDGTYVTTANDIGIDYDTDESYLYVGARNYGTSPATTEAHFDWVRASTETSGFGATCTDGRIDGSLDFDGSDDYVEVANESDFDFASGDVSISAWIYSKASQPAYAGIVSKYQPSGEGKTAWSFQYDDAEKAVFEWNNGGTFYAAETNGNIPQDQWTHVVGEVEGTTIKFYVNGTLQTTTDQLGGRQTNNHAVWFAREGDDNARFQGIIDEVRISKTSRKTDWIETEFNNQKENSTFYIEGDEDYLGDCSYSFYKPITIESDEVMGTSDHIDFPLLINIASDNDLRTTAYNGDVENANGYDIIFRDSAGRQLDHEIEKYEPSTGEFVAWVRIPTLDHDDDMTIYMYYGSTCISSSQENVSGVWDENYKGIWHLSQTPDTDGGTDEILDSKNSNDGDSQNMASNDQISGRIDGSLIFDGSNDYLEVPDDNSLDVTNVTLSAWVKSDTTGRYIIAKDPPDIETLRPMAAGDETNIASCTESNHWEAVEEVTPDDLTSTVSTSGSNYERDLYNLTDSSIGAGTINKITVHIRTYWAGNATTNQNFEKICIKSGSTVDEHEFAHQADRITWHDLSYDWTTNPDTGNPWTWEEINNLQAGVALKEGYSGGPAYAHCTQVYVEVEYTPAAGKTDVPYALSTVDGGQFMFSSGATTYDVTSTTDINDSVWHYIVGTFNGSAMKIYIDGDPEDTNTDFSGNLVTNDYNVRIGADYSTTPDNYFAGTIDEVRVSSIARDPDWIETEYNNQKANSTFYSIGDETSYCPTAVDLISFTATGQISTVLVEWETAQEIDNLGFNLYRSSEQYGSYTKLNSSLIPGLISSVSGKHYTYIDRDVTRDVLYYYMLEDVDLSGIRTMHGPVCVDWDGDGIADDYDEQVDDDSDEETDDNDPDVRLPELRFDEVDFGPEGWTPSSSYASWVKLSSFRARQEDEGIALEWETSYEVDNLGFHVYRELDGKFYRITPDLVPGSVFKVGAGRELPAGQSYMYWDGLSGGTGYELYWLDSVEFNGGRASFGPIKPEVYGQPVSKRLKERFRSIARHQVSRAKELGKARELREELSTKTKHTQSSKATFHMIDPEKPSEPRLPPSEEQWILSARPGVKIYISEDGWYRVGEPELVAAGLPPGVDPRYLQLYADGEEKSMMVTGSDDGRFDPEDAIEFYGTRLDTPFTDAHVYWLAVGSRPGRRVDSPFIDIRLDLGKRMRLPRGLRGRGAPLSFPYSVELMERTFYFAALKNGERENFFGSMVSEEPLDQLLTVAHPDPSSPEDAVLEVVLQGATDSIHQIKILFNYVEVGELGFGRQERKGVEIEVPYDLLLDGDNIVTLTAQGGSADVSLVDYIRLTYWRTYTADEDVLQFKASGGEWLSIGGFSSSEIQVVDITDPMRMSNIRGSVRAQDSGYAITVKVPSAGERTLLAFTEDKIKQPAGIEANLASSWHEINQGAEVIIVCHKDLLESVSSLKELREQQGWSVVLVDVDDLYDEFNFGSKNPWALKDFLGRAYAFWNPQPRFVLLVGDTSYDPRNYLGFGEFDLVPTKFVDTAYLNTASDDWFVDFDDDGFPELAVGRMPVESAEEVTAVVSKIIAYEGVVGLMNDALLVADINDSIDFEGASGDVADLLQGNMDVSEIYRGRSATARSDLLNLLNQGQLLVNYFGHGSTQIWNGNLLTSLDAWSLTNSPYLPFFVSMTCLNGFFQDPYIESMAETFLKAEQGGAVAVWTSSGLTLPEEQAVMNLELIRLLFNGQGLTIGEAVMGAKQAVIDRDIRRTWILFGDPTLRLK